MSFTNIHKSYISLSTIACFYEPSVQSGEPYFISLVFPYSIKQLIKKCLENIVTLSKSSVLEVY